MPLCNAKQDIGMGASTTAYSEFPMGGVHDAFGTEQAQVKVPYPKTVSFTLYSLNPADRLAQFNVWRALQGVRGYLYRTIDTGVPHSQSVLARLVQVQTDRSYESPASLEMTLEFDILEPVWRGTLRTDIITLAAVPETHTVTNSGNAIQRNVVLTITPAGANLTDLLIENITVGHVSAVSFDGVVVVANALVIDCGIGTVRNNGVNAFADFHLEAAQSIKDWLRLAPGANTIRVTRTGGNAATPCTLDYYDAWA
jgi:hypothetical protein